MVVVRQIWGTDRVTYLGPDRRTRSVPVGWTDLAPVDPFVTVAAGRAPFRLADLLSLRALIRATSTAEDGVGSTC